jgi:hypothetical protein
VVEVVWNEGQNFGTVRKRLDKFSTFRGLWRRRSRMRFRAGVDWCREDGCLKALVPRIRNQSCCRLTGLAMRVSNWPDMRLLCR